MSESLQPHELQNAKLPCPSPSPWVCSNPCPLNQWCHPNISSPFPSALTFPASGSFSLSRLLASGGQSIGDSASTLVFPMNIQGWFSSGFTGLISLQFRELSRVFPSPTVRKHQFFGIKLSLWSSSHIHTWLLEKPKLWLHRTFVSKVMSLLSNKLSRLLVA